MKHFTSTTYLINLNFTRTLFIYHKKLNSWLPPGGHVEANESPEEAARREVKEEVGVDHQRYILNSNHGKLDGRTEYMMLPHRLILERIEEDHFHMDFIFYAVLEESDFSSPEGLIMRWFAPEEIQGETSIFDNVRDMALLGFNFKGKELKYA